MQNLCQAVELLDKNGLHTATTSYSTGDCPTVSAGNRVLTGCIHLKKDENVGLRQHGGEIVQQIAGS